MKLLMQRSLKWVLIASLFVIPLLNAAPVSSADTGTIADQLVLKKDSSEMLYNGQRINAVQPTTFKDGSSYAPFSSIAKVYGFTVSYAKKTKESIATNGQLEIRFKPNSADIWVNGKIVKSSGVVFIQNGYMMIPMRTWADLTGSALTLSDSKMTFTWSSEPSAAFSILPQDIYAGQTKVTYIDQAKSPSGLRITEEHWEGKEQIYDEPGTYVVTRWVKDERGQWSEPFTLNIRVLKPNAPPVASFTTNKTVYRLGEPIIYQDSSYDDEGIVKSTWVGQSAVIFTPGDYIISLEVEDRHGLTNRMTTRITVTNDLMYTQEEYGRLFTPVGDKFLIDGGSVLQYDPIDYTVSSEPVWLGRSNSPETLLREGIVYYDTLQGKVRFLFHNQNGTNKNFSMYLIATNPNETTARVSTTAYGIGGPNMYVSTGGKLATSRFLSSIQDATDNQVVTLQPGESRIIIPQMSEVPIKAKQVLSVYADLFADRKVEFRVVVVDTGKDPIAKLPGLSYLERDNKHVRGTFGGADRTLNINGVLGLQPQRIPLADRTMDKYLNGIDAITQTPGLNIGNFGVLYKLRLQVAPRTLIALNPRGGHYAGAFVVNGNVVNTTDKSILKDSNEAGVLYRTNNTTETVEISFVLASGSNLPLQMLFIPLPELKH